MTGQTLSRPLLNKGAFSKQGDRLLILLFAFASGITVANIYYNQPLLASIAQLVVPLGDSFERRNLIVTFISGTALALLAAALLLIEPSLVLVLDPISAAGVVTSSSKRFALSRRSRENRFVCRVQLNMPV
jgi:hypothetical protein